MSIEKKCKDISEPDVCFLSFSSQLKSHSCHNLMHLLWWLFKSYLQLLTSHFYTALERTFLSYLRTGTAYAQAVVVVSQSFVLSSPAPYSRWLSYNDLGKPFVFILIAAAIVMQILGARRYFMWEKAIRYGSAVTGGWVSLLGWVVLGGIELAVLICIAVASSGDEEGE